MEKMEKVENFLTVRLLMQGKEVGSIIGKKGDNIKQIREQSGARITISDGSTPERIVTINGGVDNANKAFSMICRKFEEDLKQTCSLNSIPPITLRLIVPASQCGSIIGKGGSKIKEIRELTGASIQVASEMLPGSTERAVTVSGKLDAIVECFKQVSLIILESPPKGDTLSYKPRQVGGGNIGPNGSNTPTTMLGTSLIQAGAGGITGIAGGGSAVNSPGGQGVQAPIIFAHGQAYQVQGQYAIPLPPHEVAKLIHIGALSQAGPLHQTPLLHQTQTPPPQNGQQHQGQHNQNPTAIAAAAAAAALAAQQQQQQHQSTNSSAALSASATVAGATAGSLTQLPPPPPPPAVRQQQQQLNIQQQNPNVQAHEMSIPNDLIGCIIGRGGQKISEIRLVSGANIKIADLEDGNPDRHVSITGTPDQIQLAQFLINTSYNHHSPQSPTSSLSSTGSSTSGAGAGFGQSDLHIHTNHHHQRKVPAKTRLSLSSNNTSNSNSDPSSVHGVTSVPSSSNFSFPSLCSSFQHSSSSPPAAAVAANITINQNNTNLMNKNNNNSVASESLKTENSTTTTTTHDNNNSCSNENKQIITTTPTTANDSIAQQQEISLNSLLLFQLQQQQQNQQKQFQKSGGQSSYYPGNSGTTRREREAAAGSGGRDREAGEAGETGALRGGQGQGTSAGEKTNINTNTNTNNNNSNHTSYQSKTSYRNHTYSNNNKKKYQTTNSGLMVSELHAKRQAQIHFKPY